jgi:hypothetical protein
VQFTLFPHWYDLASEGNHFRSLQFKIIPGHGKVTLQSRFSGDIKEVSESEIEPRMRTDTSVQLPLVTELECGTVCEDTEHPNGQRVPISWDRQITRRGSDYQCRDKPAHTTPCPSDNEAERTEGLREGSDLEQPIENSFSRATA